MDLKAAQEMIMAYDTLDLAHRAMLSGYNRFKGDFSTAVSGNDGSTVEMLPFILLSAVIELMLWL